MIGALLLAVLGAELRVQPGTAYPGDAVLVTITDAESVTEAPQGRLGKAELTFLPFHAGWQALVGLPVEASAGTQPLEIELKLGSGDQKELLSGSLEVLAPNFRHRQLTVSKKFTSPSKKDLLWQARDQRAFNEAFDRDFEPFLFAHDFARPRNAPTSAPFGDLRLFNKKKQSQHQGADIDGETGDPIYAANDGEVVMVRGCWGSGNTVLLHHGGRLFTAYFHMSKFEVKEGDNVKQGQLLGLVGKTGRVTGPHLHWGAKLDGRWINPESLLGLEFDPLASPRQRPDAGAPQP